MKAGGTGTFSTLMYTKDDLGTYTCKVYTYTIREVEDNQKGVQYDKHAHTVTILVEDDGEGNLNVTYDGAQTFTTPVFTNTYTGKEPGPDPKPDDGDKIIPGKGGRMPNTGDAAPLAALAVLGAFGAAGFGLAWRRKVQ